jgi:hypothetical protein
MKSKELKPSDFCNYPWDSVSKNSESEIIAVNIMKIRRRIGDTWGELAWDKYKEERLKDGRFSEYWEKHYFDNIKGWCVSAEKALQFCPHWIK